MRQRFVLTALVFIAAFPVSIGFSVAQEPAEKPVPNPFFVLQNGIADEKHPTWDSRARTLKALAYDGLGPSGTAGVPQMLEALDAHGLKLYALYVPCNIDPDQPKYSPKLPEAIEALKGRRDSHIWLTVHSKKHRPQSTEGDDRAVQIIRELAGLCEASGIKIAMYPHAGFYVERVEDAVRLARKVDRPNVGVTFNLCHWLKVDGPKDLRKKLELARPHLLIVTLNGADRDGKTWKELIQPLDRGTFDNAELLRILRELEFRGPIGLQCYAVPGDKEENLRRSMKAWKKLQAPL